MKRRPPSVLLVVLLTLALGIFALYYTDGESQANMRMKGIVSAINAQDAKKLKGLFSTQALEECEDIDCQIADLFEFLGGDIISWELDDGFSSSEKKESGKRQRMIRPGFVVETDMGKYKIFLIDYPINTLNPHNKGLYMLEVSKSTYDGEWEAWQTRMRAGISIIQ